MVERERGSSDRPGWRIVIAGTGGQGVITAARLLATFFVQRGQQVVSSQLHGMAQRGGAVQAAVMIDCGISPTIPAGAADCVIGLEPVETVRALPYMSPRTTVFMNTAPVVPYVLAQQYVRGRGSGAYPDCDALREQIRGITPILFDVDATALARRAGLANTLNVVMLGCLFGSGLLDVKPEEFIDIVMTTAPPKVAEANSRAFQYGVEYGERIKSLRELR